MKKMLLTMLLALGLACTAQAADKTKSLYERLGGYDAISAVANDLLPRLQGDKQLGRFWAHRGADGIAREKQLLIDFLSSSAGGPMYYTGRDMVTVHKGMRISSSDWNIFMGHLKAKCRCCFQAKPSSQAGHHAPCAKCKHDVPPIWAPEQSGNYHIMMTCSQIMDNRLCV